MPSPGLLRADPNQIPAFRALFPPPVQLTFSPADFQALLRTEESSGSEPFVLPSGPYDNA